MHSVAKFSQMARRWFRALTPAALLLAAIPGGANAALINAGVGHTTTVSQSSTLGGFNATLAINGATNDFTHTLSSDSSPTWQIDLGATMRLDSLTIFNRGDGCCQSRLRDITVTVLDRNDVPVYTSPLLNAENTLGGGGTAGPAQLNLPGLNVRGRKVKITRTPDPDLSGTGGQGNADEGFILSMAEVVSSVDNLAIGKTVSESSNIGFPASNGNNGNVGDFTHTSSADNAPFWQVNLGGVHNLDSVVIHNRDGCCNGRLRDITVDVLAADGTTVLYSSPLLNPDNALGGGPNDYFGGPETLAADFHALTGGTKLGQFIRVRRTPSGIVTGNADDAIVLSMGEVQVFGSPIPEPSTVVLIVAGGLTLAAFRRRRA